ncbi:MAG TPA: endo-1,4-beta-xylanase, partial [Chthonomonadales bacterium]|nr:endo-1,4-beta-xylanase [Chthonomonadales bacterium]
PASVAGHTRAARLEASPPAGGAPWSISFGQLLTAPIQRDDHITFRAWMRSPDRVRVTFVLEQASAPHTKWIDRTVGLTPEWKEYRFLGSPDRGYGAGEAQAKWFLGHGRGVMEVTGVRVENHGATAPAGFTETIDPWAGRANPDTWRAAALRRIERYRKGDVVVSVVDRRGQPVRGASVRVEQTRHRFRFGTAAPAGRIVDTTDPENARFRRELERLYNTVTFENDLKHAAQEWGPGIGPALARQAEPWLRERGIEVRGHVLAWGDWHHLPSSLRDLRGAALREALERHVREYVSAWRGKLYLWDVVNEAANNTAVWESTGWEAFADAFRWARETDPNVRLAYNDFNIINEAPAHRRIASGRIRYLLDRGAPVDTLGIQGHMSMPLTPVYRVLEILDEWAAFGKDLEITEFTVGCPDDRVHGEYVRDVMIAAFSHPRVTAFIVWGFWEGSHWRARDGAAMFRRDWSKRPAQVHWEDLVHRQWWTRWNGRTGPDGSARTRAFYGKHRVTVTHAGRTTVATLDTRPGVPARARVVLP